MAKDLLKCDGCRAAEPKVTKFVQLRSGMLICNNCVSGCACIMNEHGLLDLDDDLDVDDLSLTEIKLELSKRAALVKRLKTREEALMHASHAQGIAEDFLSGFR
jgi:hypothetical protein